MYVSRAVEMIRDDPVSGASIGLVVETGEGVDVGGVVEELEDVGATVERELQFDDLVVDVGQEDVGAVCEVDGVVAVQTADAIGIHPDEAEEDFDPEE